ncbi:hypothetical protein pb186bvf_017161 [Paramecium bursaria]
MMNVSDYYRMYEQDLKQHIEILKRKDSQEHLSEANKCIQQMETELSGLNQKLKKQLQQEINNYKRIISQCNKPHHTKFKDDLEENDQIVDELDQLTQETLGLAESTNLRLSDGTMALNNAKYKKQELKSHIKKADLTISIMNRKITVDKGTLYIIIVLLGLIDVIALYKKIN